MTKAAVLSRAAAKLIHVTLQWNGRLDVMDSQSGPQKEWIQRPKNAPTAIMGNRSQMEPFQPV